MLSRLSIQGFKKLKSVDIEGLERITLISGRNNIGKSSILEAIFLFMDHASNDAFQKISGFRGGVISGGDSLWTPLFYDMNVDNDINIIVSDDDVTSSLKYKKDSNYLPYSAEGLPEDVLAQFRSATKRSYSLLFQFEQDDYHEEGHFSSNGAGILRQMESNLPGNELRQMRPTQMINAMLSRASSNTVNSMGQVELAGQKSLIIEALRQLDPGIEDIVTLSVHGITQLYIRINGKLLPVQYSGDGVISLLNICIAILERRNGIVLIDEIESGFHYSMYGKLWEIIDHLSMQSNCQVIATTHSYEMIASVREHLSDTNQFAYFRLGMRKEEIKSFKYSYSMLEKALGSEMEVR